VLWPESKYPRLMLVGRGSERGVVDGALEDARRGRSRMLVFTGEPGIGKSALLEYAREAGADMRVLSVAGVESETELAYAGLHALLRPVLHLADRLPAHQAQALEAALALRPSDQHDRLAASAGTLTLLAEAATEQPLLVLVDDAHWLDRPSAQAISFAARRLGGEEIALLATVRLGEESTFETRGLTEHLVPPLEEADALALLEQRHGDTLRAPVARALVAATAGNALALVELPSLLTAGQLEGDEPLEEPLPVADGIRRAFAGRLSRLDEATRRSLLVAAAGVGEPVATVRAAAAELGGGPLESAEAAGLVTLDERGVAFSHPLLRAAVHGGAAPADRRAAHQALASAHEAAGDLDARAWHLAAAAEGPDEEIASALEAAGERAVERGGYASQARALERAAGLSSDDDGRARRLYAAARAAYWGGLIGHAVRLAQSALPLTADPLVRADLRHLLAVISDFHAGYRGDAITVEDLEREAAALQPVDAERAIGLLGVVLQRRRMRLEADEAVLVAERRLELAASIDGERVIRSKQDLVQALCLAGRAAEAGALQDEVLEARAREDKLPTYASQAAEPLLWLERHDELRGLLARSVERSRAEGNLLRLAFDLTNLGALEVREGRLDSAEAAAGEALLLAEHIGMDYLAACNQSALAAVAARRGREDDCLRFAAEADRLGRALGDELVVAEAAVAVGLLALGGGRPEEAVARLEPVRDLTRSNGVREPRVVPFSGDLVEAYVRAGRIGDAETELDRLTGFADATDGRWARAVASRCAGLLAGEAEYADRFERSLSEDGASPFERGRTLLAYGERLRRSNRRRDARPHLRAALEAFEAVGATPWRERAAAELRATGETVPVRGPRGRESLTPQELQIALLVAEGKTNREVGASIFLSPKTVEFHLTRVYRKLDIHSRAELIRLLARDADGPRDQIVLERL
jgi:DNA-binding CsgD family transcriptional regulator